MKLFIKNLFLFLLPFLVFLTPPFIILLWSGEFYSVSAIEKFSQQPRTILFGQAYSNYGSELRFNEVVAREPQVITLGNSHVGQFRSAFFKNPAIFYNTTGMAVALSDYVHFVEHLAAKPPKIILANMEQNMFNPENAKNNPVRRPNPFPIRSATYDPFFEGLFRNGGWWKVYADYFSGKFTLSNIFTAPRGPVLAIGLRARVDRSGVTNDGSDYAGDIIHNTLNQQKILPSITALAASVPNTKLNQYGSEISSDALTELRAFLALAKKNSIFVIGFSPPIAHKVYLALKQQGVYAFDRLAPTLATVYKEYGFDYYDFSDIATFGSSDAEMVEVQHGGEKMYLRIFIHMAEYTPSLGQLVDLSYLKKKLASASSTYYVFGIEGD